MALKHNLKKIMNQKGMNAYDLHKCSGIPPTTTYWMLQKPTNISSRKNLLTMCSALDVKIDQLLDLRALRAELVAVGMGDIDINTLIFRIAPFLAKVAS